MIQYSQNCLEHLLAGQPSGRSLKLISSTSKRVVAYRFERQPIEGFVNPAAYLLEGAIEILSTSGIVQTIAYGELKAVCFVAEAGRFDLFDESLFFERRPKIPGLWTRFTLRDGDQLDGVLPLNLTDWPKHGYVLTPPHASGSRQRIFLPREAVTKTELQGVIGRGKLKAKAKAKSAPSDQMRMFE